MEFGGRDNPQDGTNFASPRMPVYVKNTRVNEMLAIRRA